MSCGMQCTTANFLEMLYFQRLKCARVQIENVIARVDICAREIEIRTPGHLNRQLYNWKAHRRISSERQEQNSKLPAEWFGSEWVPQQPDGSQIGAQAMYGRNAPSPNLEQVGGRHTKGGKRMVRSKAQGKSRRRGAIRSSSLLTKGLRLLLWNRNISSMLSST